MGLIKRGDPALSMEEGSGLAAPTNACISNCVPRWLDEPILDVRLRCGEGEEGEKVEGERTRQIGWKTMDPVGGSQNSFSIL